MGLRVNSVNIFGAHWNIWFSGERVHEKPIWRRDCLKSRFGQFADLRSGLCKKEGVFLMRGVYTPIYTMSTQNNLKVMKNYYEKKCLPVITKNKKHSLKQVVPIAYTLEKRVFAAATFQGLCVVYLQTK